MVCNCEKYLVISTCWCTFFPKKNLANYSFRLRDWFNRSQLCCNSKFYRCKEEDTQFLNWVLSRLSHGDIKGVGMNLHLNPTLDWLVRIRLIQLEDCCRMWVGSEISCFIPYKDVIESSWAPSGVVVSLIDQLQDLTLKSPIISTKSAFRL